MSPNSIAIKYKDHNLDNFETLVLDRNKIKLIVRHVTMFFDDEVFVYGVFTEAGGQYWIADRYLDRIDFTSLTTWLRECFAIEGAPPIDETAPPPNIVWPKKYSGTPFFTNSWPSKIIGTLWLFPNCYRRRPVADNVLEIMCS